MSDRGRILLVTVGRRVDPAVSAMAEEYRRRLPPQWQWTWIRVPEAPGSLPPNEVMVREGQRILEEAAGRLIVALDEEGREDDSAAFAERFQRLLELGRPLALVVGGAFGLSDEVLSRAQHRWSLSKLTFPHQLVPLLVAEQLYRAHTILTDHPYHKA